MTFPGLARVGVSVLALAAAAPAAAQEAFVLDELVFSSNIAPTTARRSGASVSVLSGEEVREAGAQTLAEALARLPGLSLSQNGPPGTAAELRVRGARSRYISVYIDGVLVTDPSSTSGQFENFGALSTANIARIEVLRGSQSALYGGTAVGGVINITTTAADAPEGLSQSVGVSYGSFNTLSADYALTQRQGPLTLSFGLSRTQSDGFSAAEESAGNTEADASAQSRLTFGARYDTESGLAFGVTGFLEDGFAEFDEFGAAPQDGTPDEIGTRTAGALRGYVEWSTGIWAHSAELSLFKTRRTADSPTVGAGASAFSSRFEAERLALRYTASGQVTDTLGLSFGLDGRRETATYANIPGGSRTVDTGGLFGEAVWSPTERLDVTAALRYDENSQFGGYRTGRVAFAYRPDDRTVLRGAVATGYRAPQIDELFGNYPGAFPFAGNPNLRPETSRSVEIGVDRDFDNGATLSVTAFDLRIDNLITYQFAVPTSSLANIPGTSVRRGIEVAGSLPVTDRITATAAYTHTQAESATGARLVRVPTDELVLSLDADLGAGWGMTASVQNVAGLFESGTEQAYTLANIGVTYAVSERATAFVRVENLTNAQYQTVRGYSTADRSVFFGLRADY